MEFKLQTDIGRYKRLVEVLGTAKDTVTLRAQISVLKDEITQTSKQMKEQLAECNKQTLDPREQAKLQKSVKSYTRDLETFQRALKVCAEKEMATRPKDAQVGYDPDGGGPLSSESEPLLQQQQQQQIDRLQNESEYNAAIIDERDQEIQGLVRDIGELNEMFQDVAVMVTDQGVMLDTVEANAITTQDRVQAGTEELVLAEKSQRAATAKKCCLVVCAGVVLGVIIAVLIFS